MSPCCGPIDDTTVKQYTGVTDGTGTHYLQLGFEATDGTLPDLPVAVTAQATITDVNRQAWSSSSSMLVHAADRYVGLRSSRTFVRQGDPLEMQAVVTGIDGEAISGVSLEVVAGRVESSFVGGEWTDTVIDPQTCTVVSAAEPVSCSFDSTVGGQYKVTAVVADEHGGRNRTELTTWVSGAASQPSRGVDQQSLTVVPDKAEYEAGDTAELLVQAPFATGEGLLTISRNGIRDTVRFEVRSGSAVVQLPITEADVPQLSLNLEVVGATPRTNDDGTPATDAPQRPAYAVGSMTLSVPPVSRTLAVVATPRDTELAPGASTSIDVSVKDAEGAPVQGAEFAVVVVDEAVLALSGYTLTDPLGVFYARLRRVERNLRPAADPPARPRLADRPICQRLGGQCRNRCRERRVRAGDHSGRCARCRPDRGRRAEVDGRRRCWHAGRRAVQLRCTCAVPAIGHHRCRWPRQHRPDVARQPHPLPRDGGRGQRRRPVR